MRVGSAGSASVSWNGRSVAPAAATPDQRVEPLDVLRGALVAVVPGEHVRDGEREPGGAAALEHRLEVPRGLLHRPPLHDVVDAALDDEHVGTVRTRSSRRAISSVRSP